MMPNQYSDSERAAVYKVMRERRDVRHGYLPTEIPPDVLTRVLSAGHLAGSVGLVQPWDFLLLTSLETRTRILEHVASWRSEYARSLPAARAKQFKNIKIEAILDTPVNVVVTADISRGGRHVLGARTQPRAAPQSTDLAVQNIWLAARAEGLGVNMMGFFDEGWLADLLDLPDNLQIVAYLCMGYVERFPPAAELELASWGKRRPLSWVVHQESYGRRGVPGDEPMTLLEEVIRKIRSQPPGQNQAIAANTHLDANEKAIAERLCAIASDGQPLFGTPAAVAVFAADDAQTGNTAAAQRVNAIAEGRDPIAKQSVDVEAELAVVDLGIGSKETLPGITRRRVRGADANGIPAKLEERDLIAVIEAGIETARELAVGGNRCLTVLGTGDDTDSAELVELAMRKTLDPIPDLSKLRKIEQAAAAGFLLGAAAHRIPVVVHGHFGNAAALIAQQIVPESALTCIPLKTPTSPPMYGLQAPSLVHDRTKATPDTYPISALSHIERISNHLRASSIE
jgi:nicotinate-nucleotide--dimethylbenzimidazole phosphoribosyltransferase